MQVARSTFETGMLFRSAMLFGTFELVPAEQKVAVLDEFSDRVLPGRSAEVRAHRAKELAGTVALAMPIREWSLRISDGFAEDDDEDVAGDTWAGLVRFGVPPTVVEPSPDLRDGIPVPDSVREVAAHPERLV